MELAIRALNNYVDLLEEIRVDFVNNGMQEEYNQLFPEFSVLGSASKEKKEEIVKSVYKIDRKTQPPKTDEIVHSIREFKTEAFFKKYKKAIQ